ncbi:MAG: asparagine synthase (glutamine-hydrolyzing) [Paraglaciecola sp.]|jgi:asparagine synthase (glutamine-hydrolysing)
MQVCNFQFSSPSSLTSLTLLTEQQPQIAENDEFAVLVLGNIRPMGEDYLSTSMAAWLLTLYLENPTDYYPLVAGFFNIILIDKQASRFSLVQDHIASLPLYVLEQEPGQWLVASSNRLLEKHLGKDTLNLDHQAIFNYCFFHCIPSPGSIYQGVSKLAPGEAFNVNQDNQLLRHNLYIPAYNYTDEPLQDAHQQCQKLVDDAVRRNISVNTGAFLSGGLDSSTVAGMLAKHEASAATFSIGFDAKGYDETAFAEITAKHFGTAHQVYYLKPDDIVENFVEVAAHFDEPFGNSSAMAAFICAKFAKQHGIDTMLGGDGGDEIFAGNERYVKQKKFETFQVLPNALQRLSETIFVNSPLAKLPGFSKVASYINQAKVPLPGRLESYNYLNRFPLEDMFETDFINSVDSNVPIQLQQQRFEQCPSDNKLEQMLYLDWKFTLADNDLVKVTQMCNKAGVDVRFPLLEKEVINFSCTLAPDVKLPGKKLRHFYKSAFTNFLSEHTIIKPKQGFGLPFGVWMKSEKKLKTLTHKCLQSLKLRGIFKPEFIDLAMEKHDSEHSHYYGELIWVMVILELWLSSRGR